MRLIPVSECENEILAKSIYHSSGKLMLGAGFRITPETKSRLLERGFSHVYVMEDGTENVIPEEILSNEIRNQSSYQLYSKVDQIKKMDEFKNVSKDKAIKLLDEGYMNEVNITTDLRMVVAQILDDISHTGAQYLTSIQMNSNDSQFTDHSINVTVLSILIGKKYRFNKEELSVLALGAYLHDIGKVIIDQVKNSGGLTGKDKLYEEHPTFGYLMVKNNEDISINEAMIITQHHEYQNGEGFPIGMKGHNDPPIYSTRRENRKGIYRFAEIVAVANAFDNITTASLKSSGLDLQNAIKSMVKDAGKHYNSDVVKHLIQVVPIYPVGASIRVVNIHDRTLIGYSGVVAKLNDTAINKPVIILTHDKLHRKIKPIIIDTSNLSIVDLEVVL